eukprot:IDg4187t1
MAYFPVDKRCLPDDEIRALTMNSSAFSASKTSTAVMMLSIFSFGYV